MSEGRIVATHAVCTTETKFLFKCDRPCPHQKTCRVLSFRLLHHTTPPTHALNNGPLPLPCMLAVFVLSCLCARVTITPEHRAQMRTPPAVAVGSVPGGGLQQLRLPPPRRRRCPCAESAAWPATIPAVFAAAWGGVRTESGSGVTGDQHQRAPFVRGRDGVGGP